MMNEPSVRRRGFLESLGSAALFGAASGCALPALTPKNRVLRIAHMTDFHVQPEGDSADESARALRHAQDQSDPPSVVFNTGDSIMDGLETSLKRAEEQWDLFVGIVRDECRIPVVHVIGNHDVWGWGLASSTLVSGDPVHGKEMAMEKLGLAGRYYSFDRAGWHFVVLDSSHAPSSAVHYPYIAKLDDEQLDWFVRDVEAVWSTTPICVLSHIPLLAACVYFDGPNEDSGNWVVPASWMHIDARRLRQLFLEHPNVRLCLSGHTHQQEALDYMGVRYVTGGSICGKWWDGAYLDNPRSYAMIDLYDDGSVDSTVVSY
ncbi:MAG: metallophosphoesterase [Byssovorax sp.]